MALGKSIKMYLTIFVATTCMYMVLYQYHVSRQPMPQPEIIKRKDKAYEKQSSNGIGGSYTSYFLPSNNISTTSSLNSSTHNLSSVRIVTKASNKKTSSSSAFLSLPSHTTKLLKKMNLFLWSPMSFLSSSSLPSKRLISKNSSLALKQQQKQNVSFSSLTPSTSSRITDLNNTLITSSSTSSSATTSTIITTTIKTANTTTTAIATTRTTSSTVASSNRITTIKSVTDLLQKTKQTRSPTQPEEQQQQQQTYKPPLFIITPTYRRPEQLAELTRLGYTLKHVANLLWLVIEDANKTSENVIKILNRIGVPYEYFLAPMPDEYKKAKGAKPRGVSNRNRGLQWLRENATDGVFYFADDDNTYDITIFEQMRYTKKVSMWPVGLVTKFGVSSPIVKNGKLTGFYDGWIGGRKFPVDMAGFAVSVKFLHERPNAKMPFKTGYEEDGFLKSLSPLNTTEIELLASNCTEILTWHTQTKKNNPADKLNATKYSDTNLILLDKILIRH